MHSHSSHSPFATGADVRIDALGEVALLTKIRAWLAEASPPSPQGIGDDCAVWPHPPQGEQLLFTTDAIVYGRHFDASCPPQLAAAKLLKRNLSDIAAMGGTPHSALLALTLPRNLRLAWLEQFYLGLRECSLRYATPVTGGDITEGTDNFFAAHITLIGHATRPLLRTGAKAGDHLFVTGALGGSIHGHHLHFEPRLAEGRWLAAQPDVRSMIDLTDGLAKDLPELLEAEAGSATASPHVGTEAETTSPHVEMEAEAASPHVEMSSGHFQAKGQQCPLVGGQTDGKTGGQGEAGNGISGTPSVTPAETAEAPAQTAAGGYPTAIALLDLAAIPLTTAAQGTTQAPAASAQPAVAAQPSTETAQTPVEAAQASATATAPAAAAQPLTAMAQTSAEAALAGKTPLPEPEGCGTAQPKTSGTICAAIARALSDGEDYELLFAVDGKTDPAAFIARWQAHFGITAPPAPASPPRPQPAYPYRIGQVATAAAHPQNASRLYNAASGQPLPATASGFEHLHHPLS